MQISLTIKDFHQRFQKRLKLSFVSSQVGLDRTINLTSGQDDVNKLVDYLNVIRPASVAVIGQREAAYLTSLENTACRQLLDNLIAGPLCALVLSRDASLAEDIIHFCNDAAMVVLRSELKNPQLINDLRYFVNQALADKTVEHGVFMDVLSIGTFITGDSGVGKSELALSLISRGHRLIADDVTEFSRISPGIVDGIHPGLSNEFLEVRGLGILNIRAMFGSGALRRNKNLRMIFNMVNFTPENSHEFDRIGTEDATRNVLGVDIPELTLPVAPGRNLAVMVEAAARNHILKLNGYNAAEDFIERQRRAIRANSNE